MFKVWIFLAVGEGIESGEITSQRLVMYGTDNRLTLEDAHSSAYHNTRDDGIFEDEDTVNLETICIENYTTETEPVEDEWCENMDFIYDCYTPELIEAREILLVYLVGDDLYRVTYRNTDGSASQTLISCKDGGMKQKEGYFINGEDRYVADNQIKYKYGKLFR
jgi:hypothetical protein